MHLASTLLAIIAAFTLSEAFFGLKSPGHLPFRRLPSLAATVPVGPVTELPPGERKIVDTEAGAVIVTNVGGSLYAVLAKCPHLGLPMKTGVIAIEGGEPTITCKFHNSKFALTDGKCKAWSESVFGIKGTEGIAGFVGGFGGAKSSPATVFPTSTSEEGIVSIEV